MMVLPSNALASALCCVQTIKKSTATEKPCHQESQHQEHKAHKCGDCAFCLLGAFIKTSQNRFGSFVLRPDNLETKVDFSSYRPNPPFKPPKAARSDRIT